MSWVPFDQDNHVSEIEYELWKACVQGVLTWGKIANIQSLFEEGANPFIRDSKGNYLRNVVLCGWWWRYDKDNVKCK